MDELIDRINEKTGLAREECAKVIGVILNFLHRDGPTEQVNKLIHELPGAEHFLQETDKGGHGKPGLLGGFAELMAGGEGIMTAFNDLTALGLDMGQIQTAVEEFVTFAREKVGSETVDDVISRMPALSRMV